MASPCQASARPPPCGLSLGLQPTTPPSTRHSLHSTRRILRRSLKRSSSLRSSASRRGPGSDSRPRRSGTSSTGACASPHDSRPRARSGHRSPRPNLRVIAVPAPREIGSSLSPVGLDRRARAARLDACHPLHSPGLPLVPPRPSGLGRTPVCGPWGPRRGGLRACR